MSKPSTINGQIAAVVPSAPNRDANTRPCRYDAYAAPNPTKPFAPRCTRNDHERRA
ncbi:hypothetical protein [Amycolatopsis benzoatilytica]|uniref:hypothetical protein n=1 Tax=Amycolatopsis benzoatilytica TaxID=346045 RepID=UPI003CCBF1F2